MEKNTNEMLPKDGKTIEKYKTTVYTERQRRFERGKRYQCKLKRTQKSGMIHLYHTAFLCR